MAVDLREQISGNLPRPLFQTQSDMKFRKLIMYQLFADVAKSVSRAVARDTEHP